MEIVALKQKVDNDINKHIAKYVGIKTHPIAFTIKESFQNINDGDFVGFNKSYFMRGSFVKFFSTFVNQYPVLDFATF